MPWLLVDYDAGAGGENFCAELSKSPGCVALDFFVTDNLRTKVFDRFHQGWLIPNHTPEPQDSHPELWEIIPGHRCTERARATLNNLYVIRIQRPKDQILLNYMLTQLENKVYLACEPTEELYQGTVNHLYDLTGNKAVITNTTRHDDLLTLWLTAYGIECNTTNRKAYLENLRNDIIEETESNFDLVIPYEDLFFGHEKVAKSIYETFQILIDTSWLCKYTQGFESFVLAQGTKNII
jgi:hypothetical protein